jgi:hypothetical protein
MTTRSVTSQIPSADVELTASVNPWTGLLAWWRHAVWFGLVFAMLAGAVSVRLAVRQSVVDLERNNQLMREATLQHERLRLEVQTRRRGVAMEELAKVMQLSSDVPLVTP